MSAVSSFSIECTLCPRLADFLAEQRESYPQYHARPVPSFGDINARLLIVGLAPGMHGANATGRPFTGDHAGILLYQTLFETGFSNLAEATSAEDGLKLENCRITNAVRCLPPQNKPVGAEVANCNRYLIEELAVVPRPGVILALGGVAHRAVIKALHLRQAEFSFAHAAEHTVDDGLVLLSSYHCSRYNTQTRRLTGPMFREVFERAKQLLARG